MNQYDIRRLVRNRRRLDQIEIPGIQESAGGKVAYRTELRKMLREFRQESTRDYSQEALASVALGLVLIANRAVNRILGLEAKRHTDTFIRTARRALGVDLRRVVREEDLVEYMNLAARRNAGLIKNLSEDAVKRISQANLNHLIEGSSAAKFKEQLTKDFGILDRRAELIAFDQMAKLNSDLNRVRHEQAGITEYIWTTSRDERVRARHRNLDGEVFKYGESTPAEGGVAPGQAVRCRCVARALVTF